MRNQSKMSRNHPSEALISKGNQKMWINGVGGNSAGESEPNWPPEYVIHEITIIGNRPAATSTHGYAIDTVDQRMLLMDKGNGLNAIIENLRASSDEQTFPEVTSDDEHVSSENTTARSSKSSSRLSMQSPQSDSNANMVNENQWTMKLSKPIFIEKLFDSENELKCSGDSDEAIKIEGDVTVTIQLSIDDTLIENENSEREIEENSMDNAIHKSISNEIEKQLNEKSPTDQFDERQFSIANIQNDNGQSEEENEYTTPTNTTSHDDEFEKSTTNDQHDNVEMPDALLNSILNLLLDDCAGIEKSENDVMHAEAVNSQIEHESLELPLQSILNNDEICIDDLKIAIPESWSAEQSPDSGREKLNS